MHKSHTEHPENKGDSNFGKGVYHKKRVEANISHFVTLIQNFTRRTFNTSDCLLPSEELWEMKNECLFVHRTTVLCMWGTYIKIMQTILHALCIQEMKISTNSVWRCFSHAQELFVGDLLPWITVRNVMEVMLKLNNYHTNN